MAARLTGEVLEALSQRARERFTWVPRILREPDAQGEAQRHKKPGLISKDALDWLYDLSQHPFRQTTVRDRLLGLSGYRAKKARDELEELGLVRRHVINTGRRGGQLVLEEITDRGYEYLAELQVAVRKPPGKGSYVHKFWQHKVAEWAGSVFGEAKVKIEDAGSAKSVDVSVFLPSQQGEKAVAFEILVTGENKELTNLLRDLEAGFDEVVLCVDSWQRLERLREKVLLELGEEKANRVKFQLLSQFIG